MYLFRMCVWVSVLKWRLYVSTYCACLIKCVCVCAIRTFFRKILILHMLTRNSSWNFHLFTCSHATSRSTKTGTWAPSPGDSALVLTLRSSNEAGMKNQSLAKRPTKPSHMMSPSWTLYQFSCVNCCQSLWKIWTSEGSWEQRIKIRKTRFGIPCAQTMKLFQGGLSLVGKLPKLQSSKVPYLGVFPWRSALRGAQFFGRWTCAHPTPTCLYTKKNVYKGSSLPWYGPLQSHQNTCFRYFILSSISSFRMPLRIHVQLYTSTKGRRFRGPTSNFHYLISVLHALDLLFSKGFAGKVKIKIDASTKWIPNSCMPNHRKWN